MPSLRILADTLELTDAPEEIAEAPVPKRLGVIVNHIVTQAVEGQFWHAPNAHPSTILLVGEHVFGALVTDDNGGEDMDFSWVPTLLEGIKQGRDEVIREVAYFGVQDHMIGLNAWNFLGDAVSGVLMQPVPFLPPIFNAHGHMPKKAEVPEPITFCETVGRYLWGQGWALSVAEEDRC